MTLRSSWVSVVVLAIAMTAGLEWVRSPAEAPLEAEKADQARPCVATQSQWSPPPLPVDENREAEEAALLSLIESPPSVAVLNRIIDRLGAVGSEESVPVLLDLSAQSGVLDSVGAALGQIGGDLATATLEEWLLGDRSAHRRAAERGFQRLEQVPVARLAQLLTYARDEQRRSLTRVLGASGDPAAAGALWAMLERDHREYGDGSLAAEALAMLGDPGGRLVEAMGGQGSMARTAMDAAGLLGTPAARAALLLVVEQDGALASEAVAALGHWRDDEVTAVLVAATQWGSDEVCWAAVNALADRSGLAACNVLAALLQDASVERASVAARALAKHTEAPARAALLSGAEHRHPQVRANVAAALGHHRGPEVERALVALVSDSSAQVSRSAIEALCKAAPIRAWATLAAALEPPDAEWSHRIVSALVDLNPERTRALLLAFAAAGGAKGDRALDRLTEPELVNDAVAELIIGAVAQSSGRQKHRALGRLLRLRTPRAHEAMRALVRGTDDALAAQALRALASQNAAGVEALALELLRSHDATALRGAAARVLGESKSPEAGAALLALLDEDAPEVVIPAIQALGGEPGHTGQIAALLSHSSAEVQRAAAFTLRQDGTQGAFKALIAAAQADETTPGVLDALGAMSDDPEVAAVFERAAHSDDPEIRADVVSHMGRKGGPAARAMLREAAEDPVVAVRERALSSLRRSGGDGVMVFYAERLAVEEDEGIRKMIARVLQRTGGGDDEATQALIAEALADEPEGRRGRHRGLSMHHWE